LSPGDERVATLQERADHRRERARVATALKAFKDGGGPDVRLKRKPRR
jgi:hypothetical protein